MKLEHLTDVFTKNGAKKDGPALVLPDQVDATLFIGLPGDTLAVARVVKVEHHDGMLHLDTHKGEHVLCALADVAVVKMDREAGKNRDRSAGFGK